jgi:hypothetical protein
MESPSVIMSLLFFTTLLVLGFGLNGWSLSAITLGLTVGLSFLMASIDIQSIKENWKDKRCDLDIILTSFLYKQDNDPRSTSEFMSENFNFCVSQTVQEFIKILITPLLVVFGKQLEVTGSLVNVMNILRGMKGTMMDSFQKIMNPFYERFINTGVAFAQNFQRMLSAMRRIGGIAISSLYMGLSLQVAIENFVNFIIKVVLIIMGIIAALFVILFFGLVPFLFILLTTVSVLVAGGVDAGGFSSVFCFDPNTTVQLQDGRKKRLKEIQIGEVLEDGGTVEGILKSIGQEQMYSINGIFVSGSHLIWSSDLEEWVPVESIPNAMPILAKPEYLLSLRTSTRKIVLRDAQNKPYFFRDWEELPLQMKGVDEFWNYLVTKILHQNDTRVPTEDPLCGSMTKVLLPTGEKVPIGRVQIGDSVYSQKGFTRVLAVYTGVAELPSAYSLSDGIWIQTKEKEWNHPSVTEKQQFQGGHLVTASGTFWIESESYSGFIRDFTEVGLENLPLTYSFTHSLLKKSLNKEELCVLDSSSLVY